MLYFFCLMPFLNIIFICALELLAIPIVRLFFFPRPQRKLNLGSFIGLTLIVQVYFIVATELTIRSNRPLLVDSAQEGDWTFGQTLAIALVAIPLTEVAAQSWKERKAAWARIKGLVKAAWARIKGLVKAAWDMVKGLVKAAWDMVKGLVKAAWDMIKGLVKGHRTRTSSVERNGKHYKSVLSMICSLILKSQIRIRSTR
jgi:hypothetical protein